MHTPGPWMAHGRNVYFKDPKDWPGHPPIVCKASIAYGQIQSEDARANARLIAAAPKLLEALESIAEHGDEGSRTVAHEAIGEAKGD